MSKEEFKVGDDVWFLRRNKVMNGVYSGSATDKRYCRIEKHGVDLEVSVADIFHTSEELLEHIQKQIKRLKDGMDN